MVGSTATILAGTNSSSGTAQTVSMAWRTQTLGEGLFSDVVDVSGMALSGGNGQTAPFVLQMTYNPGLILSPNELPYLGWLNPNTGIWENAVLGNYGSSNDTFVGVGAWNGDMILGDWGVNTADDTVWAVVDHNSDFAAVPEPSAIILLGISAICVAGFAWRRKRKSVAGGIFRPRRSRRPGNPVVPILSDRIEAEGSVAASPIKADRSPYFLTNVSTRVPSHPRAPSRPRCPPCSTPGRAWHMSPRPRWCHSDGRR